MKPTDLARLFKTEGPELLRRLRPFRGRVEAEDVVQSAFERILQSEASEIAEPRAYLAQLTRNLAIDHQRRHDRSPVSFVSEETLAMLSPSKELTPEEMIIAGERFAHMMGVVLALPRKERLSLLMHKLKGMTHREIAAELGVSVHNIPNYLERALAKCAAAMQAFERAGCDETSNGARKPGPDRT